MNWQLALKVVVTVAMVIAVTEIAKRNSFWAAVLASLPLTSVLAFIWLYADTGNAEQVANLSRGIFWLVLASLPLFILLPVMIGMGWSFWPSLAASCVVTIAAYFGLVALLQRLGMQL